MRLSLASAMLAMCGLVAFAPCVSAGNVDPAYLGLRGSLVFSDTGDTRGSGDFDYDEDYASGYAAALFMGWVLDDDFRLELEGGYHSADLDAVTIIRDGSATYTAGDIVETGGGARVGTAMVNLYYDVHLFDGGLLPWVGAGLGAAHIDYEIDEATGTLNGQDTTWAFAYQFMAGVTFPVSEGISMSVGYRFFQIDDFGYANLLGDKQQTDLTQHSIDVALQVHL
jgi:OmpA-OmpF porin, OOP family